MQHNTVIMEFKNNCKFCPKYNVYLDVKTGNCCSLLFQIIIITMVNNYLVSIYTVSEFLLLWMRNELHLTFEDMLHRLKVLLLLRRSWQVIICWSNDLCHFRNWYLQSSIIMVHRDSQKNFERWPWSRNHMYVIHSPTLVYLLTWKRKWYKGSYFIFIYFWEFCLN